MLCGQNWKDKNRKNQKNDERTRKENEKKMSDKEKWRCKEAGGEGDGWREEEDGEGKEE